MYFMEMAFDSDKGIGIHATEKRTIITGRDPGSLFLLQTFNSFFKSFISCFFSFSIC